MKKLTESEVKQLMGILSCINLLLIKYYLAQFSSVVHSCFVYLYLGCSAFFFSVILLFCMKKNKTLAIVLGITIALLSVSFMINLGQSNELKKERFKVVQYDFIQTPSLINTFIRKVKLVSSENSTSVIFLNQAYKFKNQIEKGNIVELVYSKSYFKGLDVIVKITPIDTQ